MILIEPHHRNGIQIDRGGEHLSVLMVRVVSAHLAAPRRTVDLHLFSTEQLTVMFHGFHVPLPLSRHHGFIDVNVLQPPVIDSLHQFLKELFLFLHSLHQPFLLPLFRRLGPKTPLRQFSHLLLLLSYHSFTKSSTIFY